MCGVGPPLTHERRLRAEAPIFVQMPTGRKVDIHKDALSRSHTPAATPPNLKLGRQSRGAGRTGGDLR